MCNITSWVSTFFYLCTRSYYLAHINANSVMHGLKHHSINCREEQINVYLEIRKALCHGMHMSSMKFRIPNQYTCISTYYIYTLFEQTRQLQTMTQYGPENGDEHFRELLADFLSRQYQADVLASVIQLYYVACVNVFHFM